MKKLIVFDLDGTLAESKAPLDAEMAALLKALLGQVKVAVISGGDWPQFESQLLANLSPDANLKNLSLLPTCGTKFHQFASNWQQLYAEDFTAAEKEKIIQSLEESVAGEHPLCYSAGVMVLSQEHPRTIRYRSVEPVLTPRLKGERHGTVHNVVFPTGIDRREDLGLADRIDVYYGMADSRIGVARLDVAEHLPPGAPADGDGPKAGRQE